MKKEKVIDEEEEEEEMEGEGDRDREQQHGKPSTQESDLGSSRCP